MSPYKLCLCTFLVPRDAPPAVRRLDLDLDLLRRQYAWVAGREGAEAEGLATLVGDLLGAAGDDFLPDPDPQPESALLPTRLVDL